MAATATLANGEALSAVSFRRRVALAGGVAALALMLPGQAVAMSSVCTITGATSNQTTCTIDPTTGSATANNKDNISGTGDGIHAAAYPLSASGVSAEATSTVTSNGSINVDGIGIYSYSDNGSASVTSTGDITSTADKGIDARANGAGSAATVTSTGNVSAAYTGIYAYSGNGAVTVTSTGSVTSTNSYGIDAEANGTGSTASVISTGDINANNTAIYASSADGAATVTSVGNVNGNDGSGIYDYASGNESLAAVNSTGAITSTDEGIYAHSNKGAVTVVSKGNITSMSSKGINAEASGEGADATVTSTGNIKSSDRGIYASSNRGAASVTSAGDIASTYGTGIYAYAGGSGSSATVRSTGNVTVTKADGIFANSDAGGATVTSTGNVSARDAGISVRAGNGAVEVTSTGNVSSGNFGIYASTDNGSVTVTSTGNVTSKYSTGIQASASGEGFGATVVSLGDVTAASNSTAISATAYGNSDYFERAYGSSGGNTGAVSVLSTGAVSVGGMYGSGIRANASGGSARDWDYYGSDQARTGGAGGNGGAVTVTANGSITTQSRYSYGITASSNGGYGGRGENASYGSSSWPVGTGGVGGNGGTVTVNANGAIMTSGYGATGINAYSQGGSGGDGGGTWSGGGTNTAGPGGAGGNGGDVNVNVASTGKITMTGDFARGIAAYSTGGTGGYDGDGYAANGNGGAVRVTNNGTISATGYESVGVMTGSSYPSKFSGNSGPVTVVNTGSITGGTNIDPGYHQGSRIPPAGVYLGGASNTLNNSGLITTADGAAGYAVAGYIGPITVNNTGTITGGLDFGEDSKANVFNNLAGGTFNAGNTSYLGGNGTLYNSGLLQAGGPGIVATSLINGNLVQTAAGKYGVTLDMTNNTASRINVDGNASLAGTVVVTPINAAYTTLPKTTILNTDGSVTNNGLGLLASPALNAQLSNDANNVYLTAKLNYAAPGLSDNETKVGKSLQHAFDTHDVTLTPVLLSLLQPQTFAAYQAALDKFVPKAGGITSGQQLSNGTQFLTALFSCRQASGAYAYIKEGSCTWAQIKTHLTERNSTSGQVGYNDNGFALSTGVQKAIGHNWFAGFGVGFTHDDLRSGSNESVSSDSGLGGLVLKYVPGPASIGLALDAGFAGNAHVRYLDTGETATAHNSQVFVGGQLRAAYLLDHGAWYAKPMVDFNATALNIGGYTESGAAANLAVDGVSKTILSVSPAIEFGGQYKLANGTLVRPYTKAGVTFFGDNTVATTAHFASDTAGSSFDVIATSDRTFADFSSGVDMLAADGMTVRLNTDSHFGATTKDISASAKVGWRF